jgi:hypothetical protein
MTKEAAKEETNPRPDWARASGSKLAEYKSMSIEGLTKIYKAKCAQFRDLNNEVAEIRGVLHAKQEIATAEKTVQAVKGKHASNAGTGGGL